ncbi:MAG: CPXCG motif-containing cysteine-rich protein [Oceanospirillaceae bacterium]
MNSLLEQSISCPYCGESIAVLIDTTDVDQQYIEDCQVCCRPINFLISTALSGDVDVAVFSDDESY